MTLADPISMMARRASQTLRWTIVGDVFVPADDGYDEARRAFDLSADQRPSVVVVAASALDVVPTSTRARRERSALSWTVPRANINAPTIMIAEKAADLIKGGSGTALGVGQRVASRPTTQGVGRRTLSR